MQNKLESPMTFDNDGNTTGYGNGNVMPPLDPAEELEWLMSLALDDALDEEEAARFEDLLNAQPANLDRWAAWQAVDSDFHAMPCVLPSVDFGEKFAHRLEIRERQRRLRTGMIFGLAAVMLWGSALVGTVILGALVWSNQGALLGGVIQTFTHWQIAFGQFGQAFFNTVESLLSMPQARVVVACYVVMAAAILGAWVVFLRRSLREVPMGEAVMVEA